MHLDALAQVSAVPDLHSKVCRKDKRQQVLSWLCKNLTDILLRYLSAWSWLHGPSQPEC